MNRQARPRTGHRNTQRRGRRLQPTKAFHEIVTTSVPAAGAGTRQQPEPCARQSRHRSSPPDLLRNRQTTHGPVPHDVPASSSRDRGLRYADRGQSASDIDPAYSDGATMSDPWSSRTRPRDCAGSSRIGDRGDRCGAGSLVDTSRGTAWRSPAGLSICAATARPREVSCPRGYAAEPPRRRRGRASPARCTARRR